MATITGTNLSNTLTGTEDPDVISALGGADTVRGNGGDDSIFGGSGGDSIDGGAGADTVLGEDGNDRVVGGQGSDSISGGSGADSLSGDAGDDSISGGTGTDQIFGGDGNDTLSAGDDELLLSTDNVFGGAGNDTLTGGGAGDDLFGGAGSDTFALQPTNVLLGETQVFGGDDGNTESDVLDLRAYYADPTLSISVQLTSPDGEDGIVVIANPLGQVLTSITFEEIERIICFTPGTMIAAQDGEVPVEALRPGDRVLTRDGGMKELRWTGRRHLGVADLMATPEFQPVLVKAGALAPGVPERDLVVSPQHRLLLTGPAAELHFDDTEVLVAARHLVGRPGILRLARTEVAYVHLLFDRHEVVLSNGAWTESFQPGDWSLRGLGSGQRDEVLGLFPELRTREGVEGYQAARMTLKRHEARLLVG